MSSNNQHEGITTMTDQKYSNSYILAIESSCDETAVSVLKYAKNTPIILSNEVSSQVKLHAKWGGVVPNLAAREHVKNIDHILKNALGEAGIKPMDIDAIAVTNGPGLIPALLVGTNYAKTLSYLWNKPLIGIHHIEGHIYSNLIGISNDQFQISNENADRNSKKSIPSIIKNSKFKIQNSSIKFPILCLVVSGGHTQLVFMKDHFDYEIIGQTVDDAVGEAFDKVARILGIGYPGGPAVAKAATEFKISNLKFQIKFPRPMMNKKNYNFSFSGLKTAVLYETKKHPELMSPVKSSKAGAKQFNGPSKKYISNICHEFQQACVDVLISKTIKAAQQYSPKTIMLAGGVSANKELRKQLEQAMSENLPETEYQIPDIFLTGDNAAMIAAAGAFRWQSMSESEKNKAFGNWKSLQPNANLKMK